MTQINLGMVTCPVCNGDGYTVEDQCCNSPIREFECCNQPIAVQAQCEQCQAKGYIVAPVENKEVLVEGDKGTPDDLAKETIQNALFATGKLQTWDCEEVCDGILLYLKDAGLQIVKL